MKRVLKLSLFAALAVNLFAGDVSKKEAIEILRAKVDHTLNGEKEYYELIKKLRGVRDDGSYEYAEYKAQGNQIGRRNSDDFNLDDKSSTIKLESSGVAYKIRFTSPEKRGWGKRNVDITLKSFTVEYTQMPDGTGNAGRVKKEETPNKTFSAGNEWEYELPRVGENVRVVANVKHDLGGWGKVDPNFKIAVVSATFTEDPSNPNAELLSIVKQGDTDALKKLGVPEYEIPPVKWSIPYGGLTFVDNDSAINTKLGLRQAKKAFDTYRDAGSKSQSYKAATDLFSGLKHAKGYATRAVFRRIELIEFYAQAHIDHDSEMAADYALRLFKEVRNKQFYVQQDTTDTDDLKDPGYGDIKDGSGSDYKQDGGDYKGDDHKGGDYKGGDHKSDYKGGDHKSDYKGGGGDYKSESICQRDSRKHSVGGRYYHELRSGVAVSRKCGWITPSKVSGQISKDMDNMDSYSSGVNVVEWHFYPAAGSSKCGPNKDVSSRLRAAGIRAIYKKGCQGSGGDIKGGGGDYKGGDHKGGDHKGGDYKGGGGDLKGGNKFYDGSDFK